MIPGPETEHRRGFRPGKRPTFPGISASAREADPERAAPSSSRGDVALSVKVKT